MFLFKITSKFLSVIWVFFQQQLALALVNNQPRSLNLFVVINGTLKKNTIATFIHSIIIVISLEISEASMLK